MTIITGTELFKRCTDRLEKKNPTKLELDTVFQDLNALLETAFIEQDQNIETLFFTIGNCLHKMNNNVMAIEAFKKCIEIRPTFLEAINNLAYVYKKLNFADEAREYFKRVIDIVESPEYNDPVDDLSRSEYYTNYGSMFVCAGDPKKAIELFNKAESINPKNIMNKYNRGLAQLELGDYENGFIGYDLGDRIDRIRERHYGYPNLPIWDGTKGKKLVVIGEQGIGDELMFGTILHDLMQDCEIVLDCHPRLADMFRRSFPQLDVYGTRKDPHDQWGTRYQLDAKVLIGSLCKYYRKKESDFKHNPYLIVHEKWNERYGKILESMGNKPKIGISWRGGTKQTGRNHRYIEMKKLLPLLRLDCDFISLQYDPGILGEVEEFNRDNGVYIHHWPDMLEDYEKTAGLVNNLDLIISVPQSVIHLAGAIGAPLTWQLAPYKTLWQVGVHNHDAPWYSNVINYWQDSSCEWDSVINRVKDDLCKLLQTNTEN